MGNREDRLDERGGVGTLYLILNNVIMRNKQLVDKRFSQIEGKIKTLKFLLSRQSSVQQFKDELETLENTVEDLKSIIERESSPLRNG